MRDIMTNLTRGSQGPLIALRFRKTMTAPPSPLPLFDPEAVEKLRAVAGASDPGFVADVAQVCGFEELHLVEVAVDVVGCLYRVALGGEAGSVSH